MREHTTHCDDCGCLSARHAQQIADANAAILKLQRVIERARKALAGGTPAGAMHAFLILDGKE